MRFILSLLTIVLLIGFTSCEGDCIDGGCSINGTCSIKHQLTVQAVLPDTATAESYTLNYGSTVRKFMGDVVTFQATSEYLDLLMFNNDGVNTALTDEGVATTSQILGSSMYYQPTPLYSLYQPGTYVLDKDTIVMNLEQRVFDYDIIVELENNDGRVQAVTEVGLSGMAKTLDLKTDELSDEAAYLSDAETDDNVVTGTVKSFGPGSGEEYVIIKYVSSTGSTNLHYALATDIVQPLTKGGQVHIIIDVQNEISLDSSGVGSGVGVTLTEREDADDIDINL